MTRRGKASSRSDVEARSTGHMPIGDVDRMTVDHENVVGRDLSGRRLVQFVAIGSRFESCRFDGVRIESASFGAGRETSEYVWCTFDGARIRFGPGGYARFVRCSFRDVDLRDWFCFAVELVDCTFSGRLKKAFLNGTVPEDQRRDAGRSRNELHGNDFAELDLVDVSFRTGIDLSAQRLPSGPEYVFVADAVGAVGRARVEVERLPEGGVRRAALGLVKALEGETAGGQSQLLLRPDNFASLPGEAVDLVFGALTAAHD